MRVTDSRILMVLKGKKGLYFDGSIVTQNLFRNSSEFIQVFYQFRITLNSVLSVKKTAELC